MKRIIPFLALFSLIDLYAQSSPSFEILDRNGNSNKTIYRTVLLEDLESADTFDGKHFKIVEGKSNEPIRFTEENPELLIKAATVYHHLSMARKFWAQEMSHDQPEYLSKVTVRLEIKNQFDPQGQFAHDNKSPQYNNAVSIPNGESPEWVPEEKRKKWGKEIWFRPMKRIETKDLPGMGPNPLTVSLNSLEQPFLNYTNNRFNQTILEHLFYPTYSANPLWVDVVRFGGTIAITKAIIEASKYMDNLFLEKWYYLDTAMIPEVIYHEYAHLVLSDHLEVTHSTPVVEGMADYFAAAQAKKRKMYAPVKGYSSSDYKDTESKKDYVHWYESNRMATSDFTLSVLWDVREVLGEKIANQVIFKARTFLKTETARINHHLIQAVLDSCDLKCERPRRDKLKLYEAFAAKGF